MVDDVLRLRATVVSDEALANIRRIGREIGLVQQQGGKGAVQAATSWQLLGKQIKGVSTELIGAVPALGGFGLGAAGAGIAARTLVSTLTDISKNIVQLGFASKELGLSTKELKGFRDEAAKAGIGPEAIMQGLANFKRNTDDFKYRLGTLRQELTAMGAGPVVDAINRATTTMDKLKIAMQFKETLDQLDPTGVKGRRFIEMLGLGAEFSRIKLGDLEKTISEMKLVTPEQERAAKQFQENLIRLGTSWEELKTKFGTSIMPSISRDLEDLNRFIELLDRITNWKGPDLDWVPQWIKDLGSGDKTARRLNFDPMGLRAQHDAEDRAKEAQALTDAKTPDERKAAEALAAAGRARRMEKTPEEQAAEDAATAAAARAKQDAAMARMKEIEQQRRDMWNRRPEFQRQSGEGFNPAFVHKASFGGAASSNADEAGVSRIIQVGVFDALVQFKGYMETGAPGGGGGGGFQQASYGRVGGGGGGGGGSGPGRGGGSDGQAAPRPGPGGQGQASPAGATVPTGAAGGSFFDALAGVESGDKNIVSGVDKDRSGRTVAQGGNADEISQGHFQINTDTWRDFAPKVGVDLVKYPNAMKAPRDIQALVASVIPFKRFGPRTQRMMQEKFGPLDKNQTVGTLAEQHGGGPAGAKPPATGPEALPAQSGEAPAVGGVSHKGSGSGLPPDVIRSMQYAGLMAGVGTNIAHGNEPGHARHRAGADAGDIDLYDEKGRKLDSRIPADRAKMSAYIEHAAASGSTGIGMGPGYMGPSRMHVGKGSPAVWGAGGSGANAPDWVRDAYNRGRANQVTPQQQQAAIDAQQKVARQQQKPTSTDRIDAAVAPPPPSGQVNVTVNSNGTKAEAETKTDGKLFQPPVVKQHRQMQPTSDASGGIDI